MSRLIPSCSRTGSLLLPGSYVLERRDSAFRIDKRQKRFIVSISGFDQ
jgi:hypothetical protein